MIVDLFGLSHPFIIFIPALVAWFLLDSFISAFYVRPIIFRGHAFCPYTKPLHVGERFQFHCVFVGRLFMCMCGLRIENRD